MKANELRIGNWVRIPDEQRNNDEIPYAEITSFTGKIAHWKQPVSMFGGVGLCHSGTDTSNLSPIPLTPELLEMCGFAKEYTDDKEPYYTLRLTNDKYNTLAFISAGTIVNLFPNEAIHITYVHQLQNLFYCLTRNELEVKM